MDTVAKRVAIMEEQLQQADESDKRLILNIHSYDDMTGEWMIHDSPLEKEEENIEFLAEWRHKIHDLNEYICINILGMTEDYGIPEEVITDYKVVSNFSYENVQVLFHETEKGVKGMTVIEWGMYGH